MGDVRFFGNSSLMLQSGGELTTDRKGLTTGRLVFKVKPNDWGGMPSMYSTHPYANFCTMERRSIRFTPGFWQVLCDYAGCEVEKSEPVYEFNPGTGNERIETHDDFVTKIAGKPSAPLNGAIFRDSNGEITTDNSIGIFDRFKLLKPDNVTRNPWAGTEEFLAVNNTIYTKSWTSRTAPSGANRPLMVVDDPPGGKAPKYTEGNYKWLQFPVAFTERARVFDNRQMWLLSAPRGWNRVVYNGTEDP